MPLTGDDIAKIAAIPGVLRIRITADGTIIINKTEVAGAEVAADMKRMGRPKVSSPKSGADRARQFRQRRVTKSPGVVTKSPGVVTKSPGVVTESPDAAPLFEPETVTKSPEAVTKSHDAGSVTQSQVPPPPFSPPLPPPPSPPTPSPSAPTDPPTQSPSPKPRQSRRQKLIEEAASTSSMAVIPEEVATDEFRAVWAEWCQWRERLAREQGYAWTAIAARNILHKCVELGTRWAIGCIRAATGQYKGPVWESRHNPDDVRNKPITQPKGHTPVVDRSKHIPNKWKLPETQQQPPLPDLFSKD